MKKITIAFLSLVFLLVGHNALASVSWNTDPGDCNPGIGIGNYTTGVGIPATGSNDCWNLSSVSANPGDSVNVQLYYHNTGSQPATNVKVTISASPGLGQVASTHTFSATITSDQGSKSLGSVQVNLSSPQALSFGSTYWYANQSHNYTVSGNQIMSGGLSFGTINNTWSAQGSTVTSFRVGSSITPPQNCTISSFTANGSSSTSINSGDPVNLNWNTSGCTSVSLSSYGNVNSSGSQTVYPNNDTNYTLTAYDSSGSSQTRTVYVNVNDNNYNNCVISNFTANGSNSISIYPGDLVNLNWSTYGCNSVSLSNYGNVNSSGSQTVYPNYNTSYALTAYNSNGNTQSRTVYVNINNYNNYNNCSISSFYASPTTVNSGQPVTLTWSTYGCNSVSLSNYGNVNSYGSQVVYPTYSTSYTLNAYSYNGGTQSRTVYVNVNSYVPPIYIEPTPIYNSCAITTVATNVGNSSVTLNGLVNGYSSNTYFEYGTSTNMGNRTSSRAVSSGSTFSETLTGLSSGKIYFYRLVSNCGNGGISRGSTEVFETIGANTTRVVYNQGTTVIGTSSPIMLKIEDRYKCMRIGDIVDYTITYKNIGSKKLTKSLLQVVLPKGVVFLNSSDGTYENSTRTVTVLLGDLDPAEEGTLYVEGKVESLDRNNAQIVTTAILIYTNPKGAQENAIAYVLNNSNCGNNNSLSASAFFSGLWGMSLIGWLILIIIILIIILIVRRYYYGRNDFSHEENGSHH